jgi:hypothetical protein
LCVTDLRMSDDEDGDLFERDAGRFGFDIDD